MRSTRETVVAAIALVAAYAIIAHCTPGCLTPQQVGSATHEACTLVQAFSGEAVVDSICATAPELAELATAAVEAMQAERADGGRKVAQCRHIPGTGTCATDAELLIAIRAVKAGRK